MERTSAACAMEWSIDLEKGLRSKKPAILRIGPRLELWDREPAINVAQYNMFGLIPGEDKLFANAILLRLMDAFSLGDTQTKLCIVKLFLSQLRNHKRRSGQHNGILFKCSLENRKELLRRVKVAFDMGDVESRALALVIFGCLADVAKDSADVRYLVLSSLVSHELLQVEASLFAGGCFAELSEDFGSILLEILINLVTSSETSSPVRLAGVRTLAKLGCSSSHACKAYKEGQKLVLCSSEEDFLVAMLISLSKLASRAACLIPVQVDLLFSFLTQEKPLRLRATALKCLHCITVRGMYHFPANAVLISTLACILDEHELPPVLQCEALQVLHKVLLYNLATMSYVDMLEFSQLLNVLENATQSPIMERRLTAISIIVDVLGKLMRKKEKALEESDSVAIPSRILSLITNQINLLVKPVPSLHELGSKIRQDVKSLFHVLLVLVENYPDLSDMVVDNICSLVENMMNEREEFLGRVEPDLPDQEIINLGGESSKFMTSKLLLYVPSVLIACFEHFNEASATTATPALNRVELLTKHVQECSLFDCFTRTVCASLLHSHITYPCILNEAEKNDNLDGNMSISFQQYFVHNEILALDCAKNMLARKDNWSAYKLGKFAACQGAWFSAAFIFEHLSAIVQSDTCCWWLKSLIEFAHAEWKVESVNLPDQGFSLANQLEIEKSAVMSFSNKLDATDQGMYCKQGLPNNIENLVEASKVLRSLEETMGAMVIPGHAFCFQRLFLALRANVLQSVADTLKLYHVPFTQDNGITVDTPSFLQWVTSMACSLNQIASQFNRLAREFDLIATSFLGMDNQSLETISVHALSCSLLAFISGFSLFFPRLHSDHILELSEERLFGILIQDLVWRLQQTDCETSRKLGLLWNIRRWPKSSILPPRSQILKISYVARGLLTACSYAVTGVVALQNEANKGKNDEILYQVAKDGLQLLLNIIIKWMLIPFQTPRQFFRVRPCILSELFALNSDSKSSAEITVLPGSHLSLSLCLQLKNVPVDLRVTWTKLYCILCCRTSFQVPPPGTTNGQIQLGSRDQEPDDMVYLNDKLLQYVKGCAKNANSMQYRRNAGDREGVEACVYFEPNERGQGFSTCLLDVSGFPPGSYRIKWQTCCVDSEGSYWTLLPSNDGPVFHVQKCD
ncbi:uncharacterized protein LOC127795255 isoform X2 [Diospyros lotus]|uniref:uncharacterized protein LOC127795255 isoform X2 n=1 Tax=Diospyros lotus TaxID=55363 RepID=UPI00224F2E59|nr:uncharacterized protein LOC127795255 isoform X2 [Diospyros lotus]XP_052182773.1 uncharacterized protein LOC127795255 isoform X2 [Diospyros lotus]